VGSDLRVVEARVDRVVLRVGARPGHAGVVIGALIAANNRGEKSGRLKPIYSQTRMV
jgi:hypothetical protein